MDNLCDSLGALASRTRIELHDGRIHSPAALVSGSRADNQPRERAASSRLVSIQSTKLPSLPLSDDKKGISFLVTVAGVSARVVDKLRLHPQLARSTTPNVFGQRSRRR